MRRILYLKSQCLQLKEVLKAMSFRGALLDAPEQGKSYVPARLVELYVWKLIMVKALLVSQKITFTKKFPRFSGICFTKDRLVKDNIGQWKKLNQKWGKYFLLFRKKENILPVHSFTTHFYYFYFPFFFSNSNF